MKFLNLIILALACYFFSCDKSDLPNDSQILGFDLLSDLNGHWVGTNETAFGFYNWFAFDFRPISAAHTHSIYEGASNQNIINSVFVADYNGAQKIFARNGGWLGNQYRATYFVLDSTENNNGTKYYRLVDAIGGAKRAFIEFRFSTDSIYFDAYKDNSGTLDEPQLHMAFKGVNKNPNYAQASIDHFNFPQPISEVDFSNAFDNLIDFDSALFLEEENDPFPKSEHNYISDLDIEIIRNLESENKSLLLFFSKEKLVAEDGTVNLQNIDNTVIRTINIVNNENNYTATYLHPDNYYLTVFLDNDNNNFPSVGDFSSVSLLENVLPNSVENTALVIDTFIQ